MLLILSLSLTLYFPPISGFLAHNIFQTGDPRLFSQFCVSSSEQLAELAINTSTQQDIIKTGVKKSVAKFLSERHNLTSPPDPEELSLSELYQHFLGPCSSPDRFILAVNELVDSAARLDILPGIKYDPRFHFDAESIPEGQAMLVERLGLVITTIKTEAKFPAARDLLGRSLHAISTFYSHTNWVEMGNMDPLPGLGYPGGEIPGMADPSVPTCQDSTLITMDLTSGYLPHQEEVEGRCRHGSQEDLPGLGGINKDTASSCWSPHAEFHQAAAELASRSVEEYLDYIRFIVNDENFAHLFDLSFGSALVIAVDRSASMCEEIEAVKVKVAEIVQTALETGVTPSRYVLVPFGDPPVPPPIVTTDPQEYLEAVMLLDCSWGGTEQFWTAIQLGLTNAPPYSDIIVFTDEPGDDTERKDGVIGLAEGLFSQVSVVYSEIGDIPEDQLDLCKATGGLCIQFNQVNAGDIVELLSSSIEESKAIISQFNDLSGFSLKGLQVDTTLVEEPEAVTEVQITGEMKSMRMQNPSRDMTVDLTDDFSMTNSGLQMEVIIRTNNLLYFKFKPDEVGEWSLILESLSPSTSYSIIALASCTFSFLSTFRYLDLATNHPNLHKLPGRPVRNSHPTVMVTMTGNYKEAVADVEKVSFIDNNGFVIESHDLNEPFYGQEDFIIQTVYQSGGLTKSPFYVRLEGRDSKGAKFYRLLPTLVSPSSTQVEVTSSSSLLESTPGNQTSAEFIVSDFGEPTEVTVDIVDDKGFLIDFDPKIISLGHNESLPINATFSVPADAVFGSVSTITVTATSVLDQTSNSVSVTLTVVSGQTDLAPPVCRLELTGAGSPCQGTPPEQCSTEDWVLGALVQDSNSGLGEVRANSEGEGNLTADFPYGTNDAVQVEYWASCCNTNVSLTVMDLLGNWATGCNAEFTMRNCSLVQILDVGPTWMYFEWSRPCDVVDEVEVDYSFTVTNLATLDPGFVHHVETCDTGRCHDNFTYATPCTEYRLDLNASYMEDLTTRQVEYRTRQAITREVVTSSPHNFHVADQGTTHLNLSWIPPVFQSCLSNYSVCYHLLPSRLGETCIRTNSTILNLTGLQPCSYYHFSLRAFTAGGLTSTAVTLDASTLPDHPGTVEDLRVRDTGVDFISVEWDVPSVNPACAQGYTATCYVNRQNTSTSRTSTPGSIMTSTSQLSSTISTTFHTSAIRSTNSATITGLFSCTFYTCEVRTIGYSHWESESQIVETKTDTNSLSAPEDFTVLSASEREAIVSWSCPQQNCHCVAEFLIRWTVPNTTMSGELTVDRAEEEVTLFGLLPCTLYTLTIQAVNEDSVVGDAAKLQLETKEAAPGAVQRLSTTSVGSEDFEARWQDPIDDPQCVADYQTSVTETLCQQAGAVNSSPHMMANWHHFTQGNLTCDTCYLLLVSPVTKTGLLGQPAGLDIWTQEC